MSYSTTCVTQPSGNTTKNPNMGCTWQIQTPCVGHSWNSHKIPQMGWTRAPQWFPLSCEQPSQSQPGRWSTGKLNTRGAGRGLRDFGEKWRESLLLPKRSKIDLLGAPTFICWKDIKETHPAGKGYNVWKMTGIWEAAEAQECQS